MDEGRDLMLKVSQGDERAFEHLVSLFQKPVMNTIYRYLGDASLAEDLAQEVFLKIYQARKRYKPLARFETWLHRIVYNTVINEAHVRRRRKALSIDGLGEGGRSKAEMLESEADSPVDDLKKKELHEKVREAVMALPANQRMVLVLNKYREMSYLDIARTLDTSVEAVKSMLFRAREKVKSKLIRYVNSEVCDEMEM